MRIKKLTYLLALLMLGGCIKEYHPRFNSESTQKYVVQGMLTNIEGWQEVNISISASLLNPEYIPLMDCQVEIRDDANQKFTLEASENGTYRVWMSAEYLVPGRSYQLIVTTPDGQVLESAFDQMPKVPEVENVYFEVEDLPTNDPEEWLSGIQYYVDLNAGEDDSRYYRWQLTETWEYHSAYPIEYYYDGEVQHVFPPDYSQFYCWRTRVVDEIYTLSTQNLTENTYAKFPLHYVKNTTEKLSVYYSLLIKQIALSEEAYGYWDQLRINNTIGEGLYGSQPMVIEGNILNKSNPDLQVLGFFQASSVSSKRVFTAPIEGLELNYSDKCSPALLRKGLREITPNMYPAYLMSSGDGQWLPILLNDECVLCTLRFGVTEKPDFWPL